MRLKVGWKLESKNVHNLEKSNEDEEWRRLNIQFEVEKVEQKFDQLYVDNSE